MSTTRITNLDRKGLDFIAKHEGGYKLVSYLCPAKVWTISAGVTFYPDGTRVKKGDSLSMEEAVTLFKTIVNHFEKSVDSYTRDDINQNQFNSLVSFAFNVGLGNLKSSTLLKKVNSDPNDVSIAKEFAKWNKANGKVLPGLVKRRLEEANMYFIK
jgi:lysozyme